jgi:hypothetical protein
MILPLIIAAWIVVMSLVAGLCAAAHVGDVELLTRAGAAARTDKAQSPAWEPAHLEISARANAHAGRATQADASLLQSGGVAA